jgi:hypothetical protein
VRPPRFVCICRFGSLALVSYPDDGVDDEPDDDDDAKQRDVCGGAGVGSDQLGSSSARARSFLVDELRRVIDCAAVVMRRLVGGW